VKCADHCLTAGEHLGFAPVTTGPHRPRRYCRDVPVVLGRRRVRTRLSLPLLAVGLGSLSRQHLPHVGSCRWQAGEDRRELVVAEAQMAFEDGGKRGTVVGGDGEVAALVEPSRREARPVAIDAATTDAAAQHPDDVAVAMVPPLLFS
jgi:hypothetical protein